MIWSFFFTATSQRKKKKEMKEKREREDFERKVFITALQGSPVLESGRELSQVSKAVALEVTVRGSPVPL